MRNDDKNSANYERTCVNDIIRDLKETGKAFIMTDTKLHEVRQYIGGIEVEPRFDEFTQCKYYEIKKRRK